MKVKLYVSLLMASVFMLNGCIEVEDNSNDELNATLQQQNEILRQQLAEQQNQNQNEEEQENTVSIAGQVADAFDESIIQAATVSVKNSFEVFVESLAVTDGSFQLEGLPLNTDIEISISSPTDAFLPRAFYVNTGPSESEITQRDFGKFIVSEPETYSIMVFNNTTNEPITGLEFSASSVSGSGSGEDEFKHVSTFDDVNGVYNIVLPRDIPVQVEASLDADRDGRLDFDPQNFQYIFGTKISINSASLLNLPPLYFDALDAPAANEVEFRLAMVDSVGEFIIGAEVEAENDLGESFVSSYDAATGQYVIASNFDNGINIQVPEFTTSETSYSNVSIGIQESSDTQFYVSTSGTNNNDTFYQIDKAEVINLVVSPLEANGSSAALTVVTSTDPLSTPGNSYSVFYSQPVSVESDQVNLFNNEAFSVTKGDASETDVVLPGTTLVEFGEAVAVTAELSLNDTRLTITPNEALQSDRRYEYNVAELIASGSDVAVDIFGDYRNFVSPVIVSDTPFSIQDVVLDNRNYANAGQVLVPFNTAGVESSFFFDRDSAYIHFPESINQLEFFSLSKVSVVRDGVSSNSFQTNEIVRNGSILAGQRSIMLRLNRNENILTVNNGNSFSRIGTRNGSALPENDVFFSVYSGEYIGDDTPTNENSITYQYAFETKAGEIETGVITLPVQ